MKQKITGFHKDSENHWVAELECGHGQHVRHDPPWTEREWVTTENGRASRLGTDLDCIKCDDFAERIAQQVWSECLEVLTKAYEDAGIAGLCGEGRWEAALGALRGMVPGPVSGRATPAASKSEQDS